MISVIGNAKFKKGQIVISKQAFRESPERSSNAWTHKVNNNAHCISCGGFIQGKPRISCTEPRHKAQWEKRQEYLKQRKNK